MEQITSAESAESVPEEQSRRKGSKAKAVMREHFSAPHIAYMAIFTALAYAVTFLEFPIFPQANFLKLDFANIFFLIEGFIFGPVEAIVSIGLKEVLCLADSGTGGVGELANFIMSSAYVIVPAVGYRFKKGKKWVMLYLSLACAVQIGISLLVNRYINFPVFGKFMGMDGVEMFHEYWMFVLYFNMIKSVVISVIVVLIYKPLSRFIKKTSEKFEKKMASVKAAHKRDKREREQAGESAEKSADVSEHAEGENAQTL